MLDDKFTIVAPAQGYHCVTHLPVPVTIRTLQDAEILLDNIASDLVQAIGRQDDKVFCEQLDRFGNYAFLYQVSGKDFVQQVNSLNVKKTLKDRMRHLYRKSSVPRKLTATCKAFSIIENGGKNQVSAMRGVAASILMDKYTIRGEVQELADMMLLNDSQETIHDPYVRYRLADFFIDRVNHHVNGKNLLRQAEFPEYLAEELAWQQRKARGWCIAGAALACSITLSGMYSIGAKGFKAYQRHQTASIQKQVVIDDILDEENEYVMKFNALLGKVAMFHKEWIDEQSVRSVYACTGELAEGSDLSKYQVRQENDCISVYVPEANDVEKVKTLLRRYVAFSKEMDKDTLELQIQQRWIDRMYASRLRELQKFEQQPLNPAVPKIIGNVLAAQNRFISKRTTLQKKFVYDIRADQFIVFPLLAKTIPIDYAPNFFGFDLEGRNPLAEIDNLARSYLRDAVVTDYETPIAPYWEKDITETNKEIRVLVR